MYPYPEANRPARELTPDDIASVLRRVVKANHGRTAAKLRSHLSTAYKRAAFARTSGTASEEMIALGVQK